MSTALGKRGGRRRRRRRRHHHHHHRQLNRITRGEGTRQCAQEQMYVRATERERGRSSEKTHRVSKQLVGKGNLASSHQ
ncbi:hypothetical protein PV325_011295 [Microctonus aethiopoides]|nr:hypothetical protein PV325_011295 [Microctonus aethiopoides]